MIEQAIELKLYKIEQLFNSMDPSPFKDRDLDYNAEKFILSWAQEYSYKTPLVLKIYLEQWPLQDPTAMIQQSVHNYFQYRLALHRREFRYLMRQARMTLLIGVAFLAACLTAGNLFSSHSHYVGANVVRESLAIIGWVAMWRPVQMYLYDWWPVYKTIQIYKKLSGIKVDVSPLIRSVGQG